MGIVRMGPPESLIQELAQKFTIPNFIETGTYYGRSAIWASHHFAKVFTVEYSQELYAQTSSRFEHIQNIEFLFGDSRIELAKLAERLHGNCLFWLDAHWSGGITYGEQDKCPLVDELKILNQATGDSFIFIDDARLFMAPPPLPHHINRWPDIATIMQLLQAGISKRYIVIIDDVIIAVPEYARAELAQYCQTENTQAWEVRRQELKNSDFRKGVRLIFEDFRRRFTFSRKGA